MPFREDLEERLRVAIVGRQIDRPTPVGVRAFVLTPERRDLRSLTAPVRVVITGPDFETRREASLIYRLFHDLARIGALAIAKCCVLAEVAGLEVACPGWIGG